MRKLPTILAFGFIVITLWRVGQFADNRMAGSWSGWVFSIFLGLAVYACAYYTRDSITAKEVVTKDGKTLEKEDKRSANVKAWAGKLLVFCVFADALFNFAEVWFTVNPKWDWGNWLLLTTTFVFGVFPTLVAAGMGALQGHIDRLPKPPANERTAMVTAFKRLAVKWMDSLGQEKPKASPVPAIAPIAERKEEKEKPQLPPLQGKRLEIYRIVSRNPATSQPQIAQEVSLSRQRVGQLMKEMQEDGYLHVNGNGKVK